MDEEKLEDLPKVQKMREGLGWRENYGSDYPWNRVKRWVASKAGQPWDKVVSEFVKLKWVPVQYRTHSRLTRYHVEANTFINDDGNICFYDRYSFSRDACHVIKESCHEVNYVHPATKLLCYHQKQKRINWKKRDEIEESKTLRILGDYHQLLKLNGIWYEVRAEKINSNVVKNAIKYG